MPSTPRRARAPSRAADARRGASARADARIRRRRARAGLPASDHGAGGRDRRRGAAPPSRPRRPHRQRDEAAPPRRFEGAHGASDRAGPGRSRSRRPTTLSSPPRCRWSTAGRGGWSTGSSVRLLRRGLPAIDAPRLPDGGGAALGRGLGQVPSSRRPGGRSPARPPLDLTLQVRRGRRRRSPTDHGGDPLAPRHVRLPTPARLPSCPASTRANGGCRTSPPRSRRG